MPWHFCYIFPLVATLLIEKGEEKSNEIKYFIKNSLRVSTHTRCVNMLRAVEQPHWLAPCFCPEPCKFTISSHCAGQVWSFLWNPKLMRNFRLQCLYFRGFSVFVFFFKILKKKVKKNYSWSANPSLISHPQPHPTRTPPPSAWEYTAVLNSLQKTS